MSKSLVNLNPHESDTSRLRQSDESHRESGRKYNPRLEHSISMCDAFNVNWDSEVDDRKDKRPEKKTPWALLTQKSLDETWLWCINNHRVLIRTMNGFTVIVQRLGFISWLRCVRVKWHSEFLCWIHSTQGPGKPCRHAIVTQGRTSIGLIRAKFCYIMSLLQGVPPIIFTQP